MWAQRRLRSAHAFAESGQSLHCPHEETLHPCAIQMRPVKILHHDQTARMRMADLTLRWAHMSEGTHVRLFTVWSVYFC